MGEHFNPDKIINFNDFCLSRDTLIITKEFFGIKAHSTSGSAVADHTPKSSTTSSATVKYHTIKSGDTLYALSLRYKTTVPAICKLNGISASKKLQVGTRLRVK
jgi:LysM repeat protein